jgi:hypothetical protein
MLRADAMSRTAFDKAIGRLREPGTSRAADALAGHAAGLDPTRVLIAAIERLAA